MAYNKRNKLKKALKIKERFKELYKPGMVIEWIFQNHIKDEFNISRSHFYSLLSTDAKGELKELDTKEAAAKFKQLTMFTEPTESDETNTTV